jgi:5-(aminomethyl)-3-furanmethanol phosphate kinase
LKTASDRNQRVVWVAKVGGSLFDLPDLKQRLNAWLESIPATHVYLLAGGGAQVEQLRQLGIRWKLSKEFLHWEAIRLMGSNARVLSELLDQIPVLREPAQVQSEFASICIIDSERWLVSGFPDLPVGWHVTSDSIAAGLAKVLRADHLVLLKSDAPLPIHSSRSDWRRAELVDEYFLTASANVSSCEIINLRQFDSPPAR